MIRDIRARARARHAGFSLVEIMVALLVISIGLLGVAKMQALALSSTGSAKTRSLAALQAASLAATMQADRAYWSGAGGTAAITITVPASGTFTSAPNDPNLVVPTGAQAGCASTTTPCTSGQLAAQDLTDWGTALQTALPGGSAVVLCTPGASANTSTCTITINWNDHIVALNTASNTGSTTTQVQTALTNFSQATSNYQLFVEP